MSACKILFFLLLALGVMCGTCDVLYGQVGSDISMDCGISKGDVEWNFNNVRIFRILGKSGNTLRGGAFKQNKFYPNGGNLKVLRLEPNDAGDYTCIQTGKQFTLYILSVFVTPGPVLVESSDAELHCNIPGKQDSQVEWKKPNNQIHDEKSQVLALKSVTSADNGQWTCVFDKLSLTVTLTVVALQTNDVEVSEGDNVLLPCSLPRPVSQRIVGGKWKADHRPEVSFPSLKYTDGKGLFWNEEKSSKFTLTSEQLSTNYSVTLMKVQRVDDGTYECTLDFERGVKSSARMKLTVLHKSETNFPKAPDTGKGKGLFVDVKTLTKEVFGVKLWIWIAVGASSVVLIGLVVVTVFVHQRNKRMKQRTRKLRSLRQPLTAKDYCQCNRNGEMQLEQRGTPLPMPRQQRNPRPGKSPNHTSDRTGLVY